MTTHSRRSVERTEVHDQGRGFPYTGSAPSGNHLTTLLRWSGMGTIFDNLYHHLTTAHPLKHHTGSPDQMTGSYQHGRQGSSPSRGVT
jgi:hypothetical protein